MADKQTAGKPTLDQRRARHAWTAIRSFAREGKGLREDGKEAGEYAREAKKLPMRIMAAGLGPALAFILAKSKGKKKHLERLHNHLTAWVIGERLQGAKKPGSLLESIVEGNSDFLRRATDESLAYL